GNAWSAEVEKVVEVVEVGGGWDVNGATSTNLHQPRKPPPTYFPATTPSNVTERGTTNPSVSPVTSRSLHRLRTLTRRFVMRAPVPIWPASTSSRLGRETGTSPTNR